MDQQLNELVAKLKEAAGANLKAVILYGSAVTGEFHAKHSDLNTLCVLERTDATAMDRLHPVVAWWTRKGQPAPMIFAAEELRRAADVFAIELLDIKAHHQVLHGQDVFAELEVPMQFHRVQVERELRTHLVRLRQSYVRAAGDAKAVLELMTRALSSFTTLFRHVLLVLGQEPPARKQDVVVKLAEQLGFDATAFQTILEVREGKRQAGQVDIPGTFRAYLDGVARVADEVDRRLEIPK